MTSRANFARPPRIALWLVRLFAPAKEAESILGDLLEEYSQVASSSGVAVARRWYRQQAVMTIAHLMGSGFRLAPWSTTAIVIGGFFLNRVVSGLPEVAIFAVLHRYRVFDRHLRAYLFFATDGIAMGHVIMSLFVGCVVALAAKGREMIATMTLTLVFCALTAAAVLVWVATGQSLTPWMLPWYAADWLAIVIGGAIVRTARSTATMPANV